MIPPWDLHWREPLWLLLALAPLGPLLLSRLVQRRGGRYADRALLPWVVLDPPRRGWRRLLSRNGAYALAWLLLAVAAAGPRVPAGAEGAPPPTGLDLLAVVDLSRSMNAVDVRPDRRRRATLELFELLERAGGSRVGVLVFAGRPHLYVPPTADFTALRTYLDHLDRLVLPTRGSNAADALDLARETLRGSERAAVVLLSDGDLGGPSPALDRAVDALASAGVPLYALGIGTPAGEAIPLAEGGWLEHDGRPVISRLNEGLLAAMAARGGSEYQRVADDAGDWAALYDRGILREASAHSAGAGAERWDEFHAWPLAGAVLLLFASLMPYGAGGAAALVLALGVMLPPPARADPGDAFAAYAAGEYAAAAALYAEVPGHAGRMGEGASRYRLEAYAVAGRQFAAAVLAAATDAQRADALYNLGNSLFQGGDYAGAARVFADVLLYRADDAQARHNLALSQALQRAVAARAGEQGLAERAGRGARSARAAEGVTIGGGASVGLDDSESDEELPLPSLPAGADALIASGLEHLRLAAQARAAAPSSTWEQDLGRARLRMQAVENDPARLWQRIFEQEEGFPAPLEQPRTRPGVPPW